MRRDDASRRRYGTGHARAAGPRIFVREVALEREARYAGDMGTWGTGILQNDAAQDSLVEAAREIEEAVVARLEESSDDAWPALIGAVGLLVQFSPYSLSRENPFSAVLANAIEQHRPRMEGVTPELARVLDALAARREPDYEVITFPPALETALHGPDASTFPVQKTWARAPEGCFHHDGARAFLQEFADQRIAKVETDFAEEEALSDLCREGFAMGDFALLLILDSVHVDPATFPRWRDAWREARQEPDPSEAEFFREYDACLESAFEYGIARFSRAQPKDG